jgi:hypothetical protein
MAPEITTITGHSLKIVEGNPGTCFDRASAADDAAVTKLEDWSKKRGR